MSDVLETLRASLAPRYDVEREIGAGGMARVFLAVEQHPRRRVAIKVLDPEISTRLMRERFIREVDLSSNLSHPHIVPIFSAGEVDGLFYYVMPYVEGESLRHRARDQRRGQPDAHPGGPTGRLARLYEPGAGDGPRGSRCQHRHLQPRLRAVRSAGGGAAGAEHDGTPGAQLDGIADGAGNAASRARRRARGEARHLPGPRPIPR